MKAGANNSDRIQIRELTEGGMSADSISLKLQIYPEVVTGFMPKDYARKKPKKLADTFG